MKTIVVSATNLVEGGPLSILDSLLSSLSSSGSQNYKIIAIVYDKQLCFHPTIEYIEIKWAKKKWLFRIYCEYIYLKKISKVLKPDIWISLHDITPNVVADMRVVYCHNSIIFYKPSILSIRFNYKEYLFSLFYRYLYQINIKKNDFVIVQQNWIRTRFCKLFDLDRQKVIVAYPEKEKMKGDNIGWTTVNKDSECLFFFPAFPRTFKNFEVICKACEKLGAKGIYNYKVIYTIKGDENGYARSIYNTYRHIEEIDFRGLISHEDVLCLYNSTDCLLFPSKLETWGLPISEFSVFNKPILAANLPYAYETAAGTKCTCFFEPDDFVTLAQRMEDVIKRDFSSFSHIPSLEAKDPVAYSWNELIEKISKVS